MATNPKYTLTSAKKKHPQERFGANGLMTTCTVAGMSHAYDVFEGYSMSPRQQYALVMNIFGSEEGDGLISMTWHCGRPRIMHVSLSIVHQLRCGRGLIGLAPEC